MSATDFHPNRAASEIDLALCRATIYSALALGFRPPTEEIIARIVEGVGSPNPKTPDPFSQNTATLTSAAAFLDPDGRWDLVASVEIVARAGKVGIAPLASSYRKLFGLTARGMAPPYETEYGNEALFQQPQELSDLVGFYTAFGLTLKSSEHERADHVSCECEFMSFLAMKEAYALEHGDTAMLAETIKAKKLFLRDHLGRFLPTFANTLARTTIPCSYSLPPGEREGEGDSHRFYRALADLCLRFISQETAALGIRLGPVNLPLRPADDERVPMACGNGTECTAMPGACIPEGAESV
jgi:TorA maturation chaperone TorD